MVDNLYFIPLWSLHPIYSMGSSGTSLQGAAQGVDGIPIVFPELVDVLRQNHGHVGLGRLDNDWGTTTFC